MSASPTTLTGNLVSDPELKFLDNGTAKLSGSIAVGHYWTDASGEKQEKTSFIDFVAWRYLADDAARVLEKGVRIIVTGRLEQRSWEQDGAKRSKVELIADDIAVAVKSIESFDRRRAGEKGAVAPKPAAARQAQRPVLKATPTQSVMEDAEPF
jgi:single-strand DNA-binding protein